MPLCLADLNAPGPCGRINELAHAGIEPGPLCKDLPQVVLPHHGASVWEVGEPSLEKLGMGRMGRATHGHLHQVAQGLRVVLHFEEHLGSSEWQTFMDLGCNWTDRALVASKTR